MNSLRARFILSHILPIIIVLPLVGILITYLFETQFILDSLAQNLEEQAYLIASFTVDREDILEDPAQADRFLSSFQISINQHVYLIRTDGQLLSDRGSIEELPIDEILGSDRVRLAIEGIPQERIEDDVLDQRVEVWMPLFDEGKNIVGVIGLTETLHGISSEVNRFRMIMISILLLELILGIGFAIFAAERLARPIREQGQAIESIASAETYSPIPVRGPDEIQKTSRSVNQLAERLDEQEQLRQRLLSNTVHELGRPLGAIRSAIHVLGNPPGDDPAIREELLTGIEGEIVQLERVLEDLTVFHGREISSEDLRLEKISLSDWLPALLLPWRAAAMEKDLTWSTEILPSIPESQFDPDRISQVIGNILSNAIKYTAEAGSVQVQAGWSADEIWISIQDTGPGIHPEEQELIFEPFYRSDRSQRFPQGLGLGLTISQEIVRAHNGRLELISAPGKGSQFKIILPLVHITSTSH